MNIDYDSKSKLYFEFPRSEMLPFIPPNTRTVLEVGCGAGAFATTLKAARDVHVTGIEPMAAAAALARSRVDIVIESDIDSALKTITTQQFDCIVCNDVLEHLVDPWAVLKQLRDFLTPSGVLVASLPNMRYLPHFKSLVLHASWEYVDAGVLDRTHLRFFTQSSMASLFRASGYEVLQIQGINSVKLPWKFGLLNMLLFNAMSDTRHPQFACVVRKVPTPN